VDCAGDLELSGPKREARLFRRRGSLAGRKRNGV
jgi:hypothetical protein